MLEIQRGKKIDRWRLGLEAKLFPRSQIGHLIKPVYLNWVTEEESNCDEPNFEITSDSRWMEFRATNHIAASFLELWNGLQCIRWVATRGKAKAGSIVATPSRLGGRRPGKLSVFRTATMLVEGSMTVHNRDSNQPDLHWRSV